MSARKRLMRDLRELELCEGVCAVSALPLEDNIFEWHVNLAPTEGPYKGTLLHLNMVFPETYPNKPPTVELCTHITHPNVFGEYICLDILKPYTTTTQYEGWSTAYSVTTIILQLQTFLFAENVPQDYGNRNVKRNTQWQAVKQAKDLAEAYKCDTCGHTSRKPWPPLRDYVPPSSGSSSSSSRGRSKHQGFMKMNLVQKGAKVDENGTLLTNLSIKWIDGVANEWFKPPRQSPYQNTSTAAKAFHSSSSKRQRLGFDYKSHGLPRGVYYEARVLNARGIARIGWATHNYRKLGYDKFSFGYGGTGKLSYDRNFEEFGGPFGAGDTITCLIDFMDQTAYFAKNGRKCHGSFMVPHRIYGGGRIYPVMCFKDCSVELNFGPANCDLRDEMFEDFVCIEDFIRPPRRRRGRKDEDRMEDEEQESEAVDIGWANQTEHTLVITLSFLTVQDIYRASDVCVNWQKTVDNYSLVGRQEIKCFHSRDSYTETTLGVGINVERFRNGAPKSINALFDILSRKAFIEEGVRTGVWGHKFEYFLPLVINKRHAENAWPYMKDSFRSITSQRFVPTLALDVIATLMNSTVVSLCMDKAKDGQIKEHASEKSLFGYCGFHHMLLYLINKHPELVNYAKQKVRSFRSNENNRHKKKCPDLGKFLIFLIVSQTSWSDVSLEFVVELFARNVKWTLKDAPHLDEITNEDLRVNGKRLRDTFKYTAVSRRLVMFQVNFCTRVGRQGTKTNDEILTSYNKSLGRPSAVVRRNFQNSCKEILKNVSDWESWFGRIYINPPSKKKLTSLLVDAIKDSERLRYHRRSWR